MAGWRSADEKVAATLRYFPPASSEELNKSKHFIIMNSRLAWSNRLGVGETGPMIDGQLYKRLAKGETDLDHWLKVNAAFGAIVAVALVAMAVVGSIGSRVTQQAATPSQTAEAGSTATPVPTRGLSR